MAQQPEALRLADLLDDNTSIRLHRPMVNQAAAELRRLHASEAAANDRAETCLIERDALRAQVERLQAEQAKPQPFDVQCDACGGDRFYRKDSNYKCPECKGTGFVERLLYTSPPAVAQAGGADERAVLELCVAALEHAGISKTTRLEALKAARAALAAKPARVALTDEQIDCLLPVPDGTAETDAVPVEVSPGFWGAEYSEVDAWSKTLVHKAIRSAEAHHGITPGDGRVT